MRINENCCAARLVALLLMAGLVGGAQDQGPEEFRISVNVDLVVLNATVHDRKGGFASDLREQDFEVYEDGVRQAIKVFRHEDVPVTVGLVIDHSGSMRKKLPDVIAAARTFARSSNQKDEMFVVNFNEHVSLGLPKGMQFTDRPDEIEAAILKSPADGQTALNDAVLTGLARLRNGGPEKKILIVISDGGDNASTHALPEVLKLAEESSAVVYTIGIFDEEDEDKNPDVLKRLARATGGEAFFPRRLEDVVPICEGIARDIRNQYTIGYVSANGVQSASVRKIHVVAGAAGKGKLAVRTRTGYIAGGVK